MPNPLNRTKNMVKKLRKLKKNIRLHSEGTYTLIMSAVLLAKATQTLPIGTAYPVWTGIGAVGSVLLGVFVFHEPATFWRLFFITTLIISIVGLKMLSTE